MANFFGDGLNNNFVGTPGADLMIGDGGNDILNGAGGNDLLLGDSGNDLLIAGAGLDTLYGGEGNDTLDASGGGPDTLIGGVGNDVYIVDSTVDTILESAGQGTDTVRSSVSYNSLDANVENLVLTGVANINGTGNNLANQITGNSGNNTLNGLGGNDNINGGVGNDNINGGADNDNINGGAGSDNITGGAGSDRFLFNTNIAATGVDTITDFTPALAPALDQDKIVLDKTIFAALETIPVAGGAALLANDFAVINANGFIENLVAGSTNAEIVYNTATGSLFYNPDNNIAGLAGGGRFATLVGSPNNVTNTDFLVVA
jgi:Ca2+-binding RTX toxin-like protein